MRSGIAHLFILATVHLVAGAPVVPRPELVRRQGAIPAIGAGPNQATDGSVIVEDEVVVKWVKSTGERDDAKCWVLVA